ncbi:MAG TPA: PorV/PorQ family protein [Caldithrix abyssi]|uniref:PorV/PorQ family protein n=1 Tax=Caldithrix abyssi TaxID=187145 RepID=A0A7V5H4L5_CALAY|nr:PorV/PorQ family protein [Caldithrix abyssi]
MFRRKIIHLLLISGLSVSMGFAQLTSSSTMSKVGTTVAQFLKIGPSARALGMGGAFTAIDDDISLLHWNPAGLARLTANEALFTHTNWIAGTNYDYMAVGIKIYNVGTIALMVSAFNSGDMDVRTVDMPDGTGEKFNTSDLMIGLSFARNLTNRFSIGGSVKYIHQRLWHMSASTVAIDIGTLFTTPFYGIRLGASMSNFGPKMRLDGRDIKFAQDPDPREEGNVEFVNAQYEMLYYSIPLNFQLGLAKDFNFGPKNRLTLALDAVHPNDNYEAVNVGTEIALQNMIFLRAGYKSLFQKDSEEGVTLGAGLNYRLYSTVVLKIDYAYEDFGVLNNVQRFSLALRF